MPKRLITKVRVWVPDSEDAVKFELDDNISGFEFIDGKSFRVIYRNGKANVYSGFPFTLDEETV